MRRIIIVLILAECLFIPVHADIAVTGVKLVTNQYVINNTELFPHYQFLTTSEIWSYESPSLVINGTFGGGYKLDGFILHAIKRTDLDPVILADISSPERVKKIYLLTLNLPHLRHQISFFLYQQVSMRTCL